MSIPAIRVGFLLGICLSSFLMVPPTAGIQAQIPGPRAYACSVDRTRIDGSMVAERSAMTDAEAPVLFSAQFAANGMIVGVDRSAQQVMVLDAALNRIREVGRRGQGPGEYADPVAAVMDSRGRVFVGDGGSGYGSVVAYSEEGGFIREDQLPLGLSPSAMVTDGERVYVAGDASFVMISFDPRPVLAAYDPVTGETEVLLHQTPDWFGEPPVYRNSHANLIPRVDIHGNVYVGFVEGYEIWKITGPEEYEVVLRGCIPERALEALRSSNPVVSAPGFPGVNMRSPAGRISYTVLTDFAVFPDGRILTRVGLWIDEEQRRSLELFSPEGELLDAWALGPGELLTVWSVMDGSDPTRHLEWFAGDGMTRLVRFPPIAGIPGSLR